MLRLTPERVLEMLEAGELEGIPAAGGGEASWSIPIRSDVSVPPPAVTAIPPEPPTGEPRDLPEEAGGPGLPPSEVSEAAETSRQTAEPARGDDVASNRQPTSESG